MTFSQFSKVKMFPHDELRVKKLLLIEVIRKAWKGKRNVYAYHSVGITKKMVLLRESYLLREDGQLQSFNRSGNRFVFEQVNLRL